MNLTLDLFQDYQSACNRKELFGKLHANLEKDFGITSIFYGCGHSAHQIEEQG